ncbi:MAG TPA: PAS domain S-box protein, partial [Proteobacteria bacterium]|nr:PAS domain S-box protein [Pseudomonadota bacterium]
DYTHTFVNKAYCDYFGHPPEEMLGHNFMIMIPEDYRSVLDGKLRNLSAENPFMTHEEHTVSESGEDRWQQWSDRAIFDDSGRLVEFQAVGRDITELKKVERVLLKREKELEQKNIALKEVLEQIGMEKQNIRDEIVANVENLLLPILNKLRLESSQIEGKYLDLFQCTLEEITSSFGKRINLPSFQLTRREIEVCSMIKTGLSSKEIAELLHISPNTVGRHRNKIRSKLNLIKSNHNLSTYLSSIPAN